MPKTPYRGSQSKANLGVCILLVKATQIAMFPNPAINRTVNQLRWLPAGYGTR